MLKKVARILDRVVIVAAVGLASCAGSTATAPVQPGLAPLDLSQVPEGTQLRLRLYHPTEALGWSLTAEGRVLNVSRSFVEASPELIWDTFSPEQLGPGRSAVGVEGGEGCDNSIPTSAILILEALGGAFGTSWQGIVWCQCGSTLNEPVRGEPIPNSLCLDEWTPAAAPPPSG